MPSDSFMLTHNGKHHRQAQNKNWESRCYNPIGNSYLNTNGPATHVDRQDKTNHMHTIKLSASQVPQLWFSNPASIFRLCLEFKSAHPKKYLYVLIQPIGVPLSFRQPLIGGCVVFGWGILQTACFADHFHILPICKSCNVCRVASGFCRRALERRRGIYCTCLILCKKWIWLQITEESFTVIQQQILSIIPGLMPTHPFRICLYLYLKNYIYLYTF